MPPRLALPEAALLAFALAALAEGGRAKAAECQAFDNLHSRADLFSARVVGTAQRVPFVRGASEAAGCPSPADACRSPSYLVPGDAVVAEEPAGGYACVDFVDSEGDEHAGSLPAAAVAREEAAPSDWSGEWIHTEARIGVQPEPGGRLRLRGDATWGSLDPDRVKRGAVSVGAFDAVATPVGDRLAFDVGASDILPVNKGDEFDCKLWLRRLGPFLLVDDNGRCGGINVTFGGVYSRGGRRR